MKAKPDRVIGNERGFSLVLVAGFMLAAAFLLGLAIDVSYLYLVKGELQSAADAGALAGAGELFPANANPPAASFPPPDFAQSQTVARAFAKKNKAAGELLLANNIERADSGYWNLARTPPEMQPPSTVPAGRCSGTGMGCRTDSECTSSETCRILDVPAVLVTVKKDVPSFFATVFGFNSFEVRATAVAARGFPQAGQPFPIAVSSCMVRDYFAQVPLPDPPLEIVIWGPYSRVPGCNTGQWTSLTTGANSASVIRDLMYNQSTPVRVGDGIQIAPGNMESLYNSLQRDFVGKVVQLPVVLDPALNMNAMVPVTGFIRFRITRVVTAGAASYVAGQFLAYYEDSNASSPGGSRGNIVTPPTLVQ